MQLTQKLKDKGWIETTLGEVVELAQGVAINAKTDYVLTEWGIGLPLLKINNLLNNTVDQWANPDLVTKKAILSIDDVVFTRTGQVGWVFTGKKGILHNNSFKVIPGKLLTNKFLYWFLKQKSIYDYAQKVASGSAQPDLNHGAFRTIKISLPPLPTQKAIADVLSSLDDKIECLREQNKILEETGQTIFKEWFGKYSVERPEELPDGWRVYELRELFTFVKGKKPISTSSIFTEGLLPQILIDTFNSGEVVYADSKNTVLADTDDVIMVMDGASSGRVEFGYFGIVGSTLSVLQTKREIKSILYFYLKVKEKDIKEKTTGSAIPHTDKNKVYNYEIILNDNFSEIENLLQSFRKKIIYNRRQIQSLTLTRDTLLPRLMSGEVGV